MASDPSLKILIQAEVKQALDAMQQASKSAGTLAGDLGKVKSPASEAAAGVASLGKSLGDLAARAATFAAVAVAAAAVKDAMIGIIETGAKFESLTASVTGLMGSLAAGNVAIAWIKDFAAKTPFELDGVTAAFVKLKAFGMDPMDGTMQALADTTARMNGGQQELEGIIMAVGQAWSKGKLQTEEALQLVERGVDVWGLLSEALGIGAEKLQEMATKGELGRDVIKTLVEAMGTLNAGAAIGAMDTFSGRLSNLQDAWAEMQNTLAQAGILDAAKDILSDLSAAIGDLTASGDLQAWGENVAMGMRVASLSVKLLGDAAAVTHSLVKPLVDLFAKMNFGPAIVAFKAAGIAMDKAADAEAIVKLGEYLAQTQADMEKFGAAGKDAAAEIYALWEQFRAGAITAEEAKKSAEDLMMGLVEGAKEAKQAEAELAEERAKNAKEAVAVEKDLVKEKKQLAKLQADSAKAAAKAELDSAKEGMKAKIDASKDALAEKKKDLAESLSDEKAYTKDIEKLRASLGDALISDEDRLRKIRQSSMKDAEKQADVEKQVAEKIKAARKFASEGDNDTAKMMAEKAKDLAESLEDQDKATSLYKKAAGVYKQAAEAEIAAAEQGKAAQQAKTDALEASVAKQKAALNGLNDTLGGMTEEAHVLKIEADTAEAEAKIAELQEKLDRLNGRAGGGAIQGYANGGQIPGYAAGGHPITLRPGLIRGPGTGTSDSILARVSNGEHAFITRAARARQLWPLLNALNFGSDALVERVLANLPGGMAQAARPVSLAGGYAGGGAVMASDTVNINLNLGGSTVRLQGARDQANALAVALRELQRGL